MKTTLSTLSLILALSAVSPVLAEMDSNVHVETGARINVSGVRQEIKNDIKDTRGEINDRRGDLKDQVKDVRASMTEGRKDVRMDIKELRLNFRGDVAKMRVGMAIRVYTAAVNGLDNAIVRINSRIAKIKTQGGNTTEAEASVVAAQTNILSAKAHAAVIASLNLGNISSSTAPAIFDQAKTEAQAVRKDLESAKQNLLKAVRSLAAVEKSLHANASTTGSVRN